MRNFTQSTRVPSPGLTAKAIASAADRLVAMDPGGKVRAAKAVPLDNAAMALVRQARTTVVRLEIAEVVREPLTAANFARVAVQDAAPIRIFTVSPPRHCRKSQFL